MTPSQEIIALSDRWLEIAKASGPTEPPPEEAFDFWYAILRLVLSNRSKLTKGVRVQLKENLKATGNRPAFQELEAKPWKLALTVLKHPKDFNSTLRDPTSNGWFKDFASLRENKKAAPIARSGFDFIR